MTVVAEGIKSERRLRNFPATALSKRRVSMVRKFVAASIATLLVAFYAGSAHADDEIVYEGDWRAGETGFINHDCGNNGFRYSSDFGDRYHSVSYDNEPVYYSTPIYYQGSRY
jgi:hypothetical protein